MVINFEKKHIYCYIVFYCCLVDTDTQTFTFKLKFQFVNDLSGSTILENLQHVSKKVRAEVINQ